jgi:hypothetical protein
MVSNFKGVKMVQEPGNDGKGIFFDKVNHKVSILQGVSFEIIHGLLEASGSKVEYAVTPEGMVIADCELDGASYCAMLLESDGTGVQSVDKLGETLILRLALSAPEGGDQDDLMKLANSWNIERVSGRSFTTDGLLVYEFRIGLNGITSDYFEDHIFEWYDTIADFINFVIDSTRSEN